MATYRSLRLARCIKRITTDSNSRQSKKMWHYYKITATASAVKFITVEPRFNEVAGNRPSLFVKWRVRYIEVLFHTFYCNFGRDIEIISFVISRTSLNRGSLNRSSTVIKVRLKVLLLLILSKICGVRLWELRNKRKV